MKTEEIKSFLEKKLGDKDRLETESFGSAWAEKELSVEEVIISGDYALARVERKFYYFSTNDDPAMIADEIFLIHIPSGKIKSMPGMEDEKESRYLLFQHISSLSLNVDKEEKREIKVKIEYDDGCGDSYHYVFVNNKFFRTYYYQEDPEDEKYE